MTSTNKFLKNYTILLDKIPKYPNFKHIFKVDIDEPLFQAIMKSEDPVFKPETKKLLSNLFPHITDNVLTVHHHQNYNVGRFCANNSISPICLSRHIKHTLFTYLNWIDIDMVKGHPSIIFNLAKNNNLYLPTFDEYLKHPETKFDMLSEYYSDPCGVALTHDHIKGIFNVMIYGGGFSTWENDLLEKEGIAINQRAEIHPFIVAFKNEVKTITRIIYDANPELINHIKGDLTDKYEIQCRLMSYYCGCLENEIVYTTATYLIKNGLMDAKRFLPEYDGLCLPTPEKAFDANQVIFEINNLILKQTGLAVKMKFKGYQAKHVHQKVIDARVVKTKTPNTVGVWDDEEAAKTVFKLYPHWVCCENVLFVYDVSTGLWCNDTVVHNKIIISLKNNLFVLLKNNQGGILVTTTSYGNNLTLMNKIAPILKTMCINNDWITDMENTSLGKILFANGIYNFKTSQFHLAVDGKFDCPEILFGARLKQDFNNFTDEDMLYMETIKKRFFHDPLGQEMGDYLLQNLSRAIAGDLMKRICFGLGESNSGKSTLAKAYLASFGGYVGSFNAENLCYKNTGADEAQLMRWAYLLRFKRVIFSNEIKTDVALSGNLIKKISSGGDGIVARLHGGNETSFIPHFMSMIFANDLPPIKPLDDALNKRMSVYSYEKAFVENPSNEFELKKDENIEIEMGTELFQRCLIGLTILTYLNYVEGGCLDIIPESVKNSKMEWVNTDEANIAELFKNDFELTNVATDFILSSDISDWIADKKLGISMKKFGVDMKKYCCIKKLGNIKNYVKKVGGKGKQVWCGIKMIEAIDK
jgi:hypothetical protein